MEEQRDANAVEVITDVPWGSAAHVEIGEARRERHDSGERLDDAERIAKGAGHEARLGLRETHRLGLVLLFVDRDVDRIGRRWWRWRPVILGRRRRIGGSGRIRERNGW